jgi:hypothetical protein
LTSPADAPAPAPVTAASAGDAQNWLALVDRQSWTESWNSAGTIFRTQITAQAWGATISPFRKPLGAVLSRSLAKVTRTSTLPGVPEGSYEILEFQTSFATKSDAVETVVMAREAAGWRVDGYFIR